MHPELRIEGSAAVNDWKPRLDHAASLVQAHNQAEAAKVAARKRRGIIVLVVGLALAAGAGVFAGGQVAIVVAVVSAIAMFFAIKGPAPDYIGAERVEFVRGLLGELGKAAPGAQIQLAAALDPRTGVPQLGPERAGMSEAEKTDAWLSGSLAGLPGLRLSWKVVEWRKAVVRRKRNRKGRVKEKVKFAMAATLAVRLDADRVLYSLKPEGRKSPEGELAVAEKPRCWRMRAVHQTTTLKLALPSADLKASLAGLREKKQRDVFGPGYPALVSLMRLCESRLAPRPKEKAA